MKKILALILLCFSGLTYAQTTNVTATITDSDGSVWSNASVTVQFFPNPNVPNLNNYTIAGVPITSATYSSYLQQTVQTNSSGVLSVTVLNNSLVSPSGSTQYFVIKSNSSAQATAYVPIAVSGASQSLTSYLSTNAVAPRFPAYGGFAYGYADVEVTPVPNAGGFYFNTTTGVQRIWTGSTWTNSAGGGGASFPGTNGFVCNTSTTASTTCNNAQLLTLLGFTPVANTVTVNGNPLSANVVVTASQITSGTLPHAQLPALVSGDIPNNAANTTGNANTATLATSATTATNIAGGALGSVLYQSSSGNTATVASPTGAGNTYVYGWQPSGSAIAPAAINLGVLPTGGTLADTSSAQTFTNKSINGSEINSGTVPAAAMPAFSGDISTSAGSTVATLPTVNSGPGSCGSATQTCAVTTNAKGLVTSQTATTIAVNEYNITPGNNTWGNYTTNQVLFSTKVNYSGHFVSLTAVNTDGATCTTPPSFNIFDGTSNTGTAVTGITTTQTKGNATVQTESQTVAAGDIVGIYVSTAGSGCANVHWSISAELIGP